VKVICTMERMNTNRKSSVIGRHTARSGAQSKRACASCAWRPMGGINASMATVSATPGAAAHGSAACPNHCNTAEK
jgi:hypothetical protein